MCSLEKCYEFLMFINRLKRLVKSIRWSGLIKLSGELRRTLCEHSLGFCASIFRLTASDLRQKRQAAMQMHIKCIIKNKIFKFKCFFFFAPFRNKCSHIFRVVCRLRLLGSWSEWVHFKIALWMHGSGKKCATDTPNENKLAHTKI